MSFVKVSGYELLTGPKGGVSERATELMINSSFIRGIVGKHVITTEAEGLGFTLDRIKYVRLEFLSFEG